MASPFFSGRIPQELMDKIEANIDATRKTKTDILVSALEMYLDSPQASEKANNDIEKLWSAIASLRKEFQQEIAELRQTLAA